MLLLTLATSLALGACTTSGQNNQGSGGAPTTSEIEETIKRTFTDTYGVDNGGAKFDTIDFKFGTPTVGDVTDKQVKSGAPAQPTYPVKIQVDITVNYSNNPSSRHVTRGTANDDVFFFYKDSFGDWQVRTGSL